MLNERQLSRSLLPPKGRVLSPSNHSRIQEVLLIVHADIKVHRQRGQAPFDSSRQGKKGLESPREEKEGAYRSGDGGEEPA